MEYTRGKISLSSRQFRAGLRRDGTSVEHERKVVVFDIDAKLRGQERRWSVARAQM